MMIMMMMMMAMIDLEHFFYNAIHCDDHVSNTYSIFSETVAHAKIVAHVQLFSSLLWVTFPSFEVFASTFVIKQQLMKRCEGNK
jgi:hypothetical protein